MRPLISICIPAYKNEALFKRLLDSIQIQLFTNFEVVVTDDSPDENLKELCLIFEEKFQIKYFKNKNALGSPANWNYAISKAEGEWIKIMHADDWFASEKSLSAFVAAIKGNSSFIFSAYSNVDSSHNSSNPNRLSQLELMILKNSPYNLFKKNFIGHPSTTLIKRIRDGIFYDENIKWVVDFDYYIRYLSLYKSFIYVETPLINIGIHENQITKSSFRIKEIEIPENLYLLKKIGLNKLKNIFVYDYYWRLCRNLQLRIPSDISPYYEIESIPEPILKIIKFQSRFPISFLQTGICSKLTMLISYLKNILSGV